MIGPDSFQFAAKKVISRLFRNEVQKKRTDGFPSAKPQEEGIFYLSLFLVPRELATNMPEQSRCS